MLFCREEKYRSQVVTAVLLGGLWSRYDSCVGMLVRHLFSYRDQAIVRRTMKLLKVNLLSCVVVAMLIPLLVTTGIAQAAGWSVVPSPSPNSKVGGSELKAVAVVAANNVWAVGNFAVPNATCTNCTFDTLIEHWNGTKWSVVPSPSVGNGSDTLEAITVISAKDIWAVGNHDDSATGDNQTLTEHWNGSKWSLVASPNVGTDSDNFLNGVTAVSANNVWAVGSEKASSTTQVQTLIEHWNGTKWSVVTSPNVGTGNNNLNGVTTVSAKDVWAVGAFVDINGNDNTLTEHWNGTKWSVVTSPNRVTGVNILFAVKATSTNDVWAVGQASPLSLIEHWNGTTWSVVTSPSPGTTDNILGGVAIISAKNIWAVGYSNTNGSLKTLTEHWNGTTWSVVASPSPNANLNFLFGVAADPSTGQTWAVGTIPGSTFFKTFIEFHP
jgi:hypothetical protein